MQDLMGTALAHLAEKRNPYRVVVENFEGKTLFQRPRCNCIYIYIYIYIFKKMLNLILQETGLGDVD